MAIVDSVPDLDMQLNSKDRYASEAMRDSLSHPGSILRNITTPQHNARASVGFAHQPTGRFDLPKMLPPGVYAVPGPGAYSHAITRRGADTLTNSGKPVFGKEEQRPDV